MTLPGPGRRRIALALAWAAGGLAAGVPGRAQTDAPISLERKVKAAFLYKFLAYAEFPVGALSEPGAPVVIGLVDADELAGELTRIVSGRTVGNRLITVRVFRHQERAGGVHLLLVGGAHAGKVRCVLHAIAPAPLLLVTQAEDALRQGSVINFRIVDGRVRFDVSPAAAEKNNVKRSSRLLTVASQVHKGAP